MMLQIIKSGAEIGWIWQEAISHVVRGNVWTLTSLLNPPPPHIILLPGRNYVMKIRRSDRPAALRLTAWVWRRIHLSFFLQFYRDVNITLRSKSKQNPHSAHTRHNIRSFPGGNMRISSGSIWCADDFFCFNMILESVSVTWLKSPQEDS